MWWPIKALPDLFQRKERTIREWRTKWKGKVREKDGKVWGRDVIQWYINEFCSNKEHTKIDQLLKVQKLKSEQLDYEIKLKKYVPVADVEREWHECISEMRQSLLALEVKLADQLADKTGRSIPEVRYVLRREIYSMLGNLYREAKYRPVPRKNLSWQLQEKALDLFWRQIKSLPPRKYKTIEVKIKAKTR